MYIAVSNRVSLAGSSEPVLPADHPIDKDAAEGALGMICAAGDKLGVYTASTDPTLPHTSLAPMRRHFVDIAVVVDGQQPALELEGASGFAVAITSHSVRNASTRSSWRACRCPDDRRRPSGDAVTQRAKGRRVSSGYNRCRLGVLTRLAQGASFCDCGAKKFFAGWTWNMSVHAT